MPLNTAVEYFVGKSHIETGRMSDLLTVKRTYYRYDATESRTSISQPSKNILDSRFG